MGVALFCKRDTGNISPRFWEQLISQETWDSLLWLKSIFRVKFRKPKTRNKLARNKPIIHSQLFQSLSIAEAFLATPGFNWVDHSISEHLLFSFNHIICHCQGARWSMPIPKGGRELLMICLCSSEPGWCSTSCWILLAPHLMTDTSSSREQCVAAKNSRVLRCQSTCDKHHGICESFDR